MTGSLPSGQDRIHPRLARYRSAPYLRMYAIAGCVALLAGLLVSYVSLIAGGNAGPKQTDFVSYYSAAHLVISGAGSHIYDLTAVGQYERALVHPLTVRNGVLPYVYPPYVAILTAPMSLLPYRVAWVLWLGINLLLVAAAIASFQHYLSLGRMSGVLLWAASLSFLPVFVALAQGQISIVLLALLTAAFFASRSRHWWLAGTLLSLALVKPQYVAPILLVLIVRRHWACLAAIATSALIVLAGSALILGPGSETGYLRVLRDAAGWRGQFGYSASLNQSVYGFLQLLIRPSIALPLTAIIAGAAVLALVRTSFRSPNLDIPYAFAVVTGVALGPHVLIHDLSLLLLPVVVAVHYRYTGPPHLTALLLSGSAAVLAGMPLTSIIPIQMSVLAMLALGIWLYRVRPNRIPAAVSIGLTARALSPVSHPR